MLFAKSKTSFDFQIIFLVFTSEFVVKVKSYCLLKTSNHGGTSRRTNVTFAVRKLKMIDKSKNEKRN